MIRLASCFSNRGFSRGSFSSVLNHERLWLQLQRCRLKSAMAMLEEDESILSNSKNDEKISSHVNSELQRLRKIRNVGVFAHVDAGKTTVTERMLALAGVVRRAGNVDDGNTVTDYLPAERERGITIQSAAISFRWAWHNNRSEDDNDEANDSVTIALIDTPGHVDFSVEVNRSVAVLDGAVLVVDAVAGVQAQTETVWRAMTRPSLNNHDLASTEIVGRLSSSSRDHGHEPLPCLAVVNKMDKIGCNFGDAIRSLRNKLPGANPIPIQLPLFRSNTSAGTSSLFPRGAMALPVDSSDSGSNAGDFLGVVDLIHMRAIVWPINASVSDVENCVPDVISLVQPGTKDLVDPDCPITQEALVARSALIEKIANVDEKIEEYYLNEEQPSNAELRLALRRATLAQVALPVMAGAALRGKGVEPVLDAIADFLPSPLDRSPPALLKLNTKEPNSQSKNDERMSRRIPLGHPLHPSLLALAFKVVHMKGRGGSGDGRVVFARVYSGELRGRDTIHAIGPPAPGEAPQEPRKERIGGMLELAGGRFNNLEEGLCRSGDVCALVGLKSVSTGDTLVGVPERGKGKKHPKMTESVYLAGVASPKPVLKVRLEVETAAQQARLSEALALLTIEDPSLVVEETESSTLLSGLGELHIDITLDRLRREFDLNVLAGEPSVAYRETIVDNMETAGLFNYDRTVGGTRLQAAVHLILKPFWSHGSDGDVPCMNLSDPSVSVSDEVKTFLDLDPEMTDDELILRSELFKGLIQGCQGALRRGPLSYYEMANMKCHVIAVDAEEGLPGLLAMPGALRAAAANTVSTLLSKNLDLCTVLEPKMSIEISLPNDMVGAVLSDLTGRRGNVEDVLVGDNEGTAVKALIRGHVPLVEILGYANSIRSLTGGEGAFTAEYKGHSPSIAPVKS